MVVLFCLSQWLDTGFWFYYRLKVASTGEKQFCKYGMFTFPACYFPMSYGLMMLGQSSKPQLPVRHEILELNSQPSAVLCIAYCLTFCRLRERNAFWLRLFWRSYNGFFGISPSWRSIWVTLHPKANASITHLESICWTVKAVAWARGKAAQKWARGPSKLICK